MANLANEIHQRLLLARLPVMPEVLLRLLDVFESTDRSARDVVSLLVADAALAARVLACANAGLEYRGRRVSSLSDAVVTLGFDAIKTLAVSEAVRQAFGGFQNQGAADLRHFWRHSLMVAFLSRLLAQRAGYEHPDEAYLAGLLHDVGELALLSVMAADYGRLLSAHPGEEGLVPAEIAALGLSHADVGGWLLRKWHLHERIADSVLYHHEDPVSVLNADPLIQLVVAADLFASASAPAAAPAGALALADLTPEALGILCEQARTMVAELATQLGIALPEAPEDAGRLATTRTELAERVRDYTIVAQGRDLLRGAPGALELAPAVRHAGAAMFGCRHCLMFVREAAGEALRPMVEDDHPVRRLAIQKVPGPGAIAVTASGGDPVWMQAAPIDGVEPSLADRQLLRLIGCAMGLTLPLRHADRVFGVLVLGFDEAGASAMQARLPALRMFAASVSEQLANLGQERGAGQHLQALSAYRDSARKLAHEVNNPLSIIRNYLHVLREKAAKGESVDKDVQLITREIERSSAILGPLSADLLPVQADGTQLDCNGVIREVLDFCTASRFVPTGCAVELQLEKVLPPVRAERDALKQVLLNLIKNAVEALPLGGLIKVRSSGSFNLDGRACVGISISDNGPGVPAEVLAGLFSPMRSTKGSGHSGLGLCVAYELVRRWGGSMQCRTGPDGTLFDVLIPVSAGATQ
jgi:putative nucleotidyltransferase with HDIG domain